MGEGFSHNMKQHKEDDYNYLIKVKPYEENIWRTTYLIRDIFTTKQLFALQEFITDIIEERNG